MSHSIQFPAESPVQGSFHFNSDFSGDVLICVRREHHSENEYDELSIPGVALEHFLGTMIERKLGDVGDDIMRLILGKISKP